MSVVRSIGGIGENKRDTVYPFRALLRRDPRNPALLFLTNYCAGGLAGSYVRYVSVTGTSIVIEGLGSMVRPGREPVSA